MHWLKARRLNDHFLELRLSTQAGTYIKEFVHGDLGRTRPSLRTLLGSPADILQLDLEGLIEEGQDTITSGNAQAAGSQADADSEEDMC